MKRLLKFRWDFLIAVPFVMAVVGSGLWLAIAAAYENIRLSDAQSQMLDAVAMARDIAADTSVPFDKETDRLLYRLAQSKTMAVATVEQNADGPTMRSLRNPWNGFVDAEIRPGPFLRLETHLPPAACRRLIQFFGEALPQGVVRVETRDDVPGTPFRQLYGAPSPGGVASLSEESIKTGCGQKKQAVLVLTFRLR